ncbi:hypothetical protein AAFF_G00319820 [Aldrovandia affinis]|uniref:Uncharacterized protein n=1 Tax=Aldrovandia affinis TaxID=143900 RepID=A0AAD7WRB5_9TELE|nr:hypothetical protein AAFF_G00319820 [Aldrovandia affinis]
MDSAGNSKGENKILVGRSAPRSVIFRCLVALPTVACFMLSVSSIAICFLVSFKTSQLEHRVHALEMEKKSVFHPPEASFLAEDGTVLPVFRDTIEQLLQEKLNEAMPKLRKVYLDVCAPTLFDRSHSKGIDLCFAHKPLLKHI